MSSLVCQRRARWAPFGDCKLSSVAVSPAVFTVWGIGAFDMFRPMQRLGLLCYWDAIFLSLGYRSPSQQLWATNSWPLYLEELSSHGTQASYQAEDAWLLSWQLKQLPPSSGCGQQSSTDLGTGKTESLIPLPQPKLIRKIWHFLFRFLSQAGLTDIRPSASASGVITGMYHLILRILCNSIFFPPPVKALKETERELPFPPPNPHLSSPPTPPCCWGQRCSHSGKQLSSCSKDSTESPCGPSVLHTCMSTQKLGGVFAAVWLL